MNKTEQLYDIAKRAVTSFFNKEASLNEVLIKEATENNLNSEEIRRISEIANTRTYLELRKTAEANYVKFDLADPETIIKTANVSSPQISNEVKIESHADYFRAPVKAASLEKTAEVEIEKMASTIEYQVPYFEKSLKSLKDNIQMNSLTFDQRINALTKQVKQLLRGGVDKSHIKSLFKAVDKSEIIWNAITDQLEDEYPLLKEASAVDMAINTSHSIVKEVNELVKIAQHIVTEAIMYENIYDTFEKEASIVIEKVKPLAKKIGFVTLLGGAYAAGSASERKKEELKRINQYNNLKPRGPLQ